MRTFPESEHETVFDVASANETCGTILHRCSSIGVHVSEIFIGVRHCRYTDGLDTRHRVIVIGVVDEEVVIVEGLVQ